MAKIGFSDELKLCPCCGSRAFIETRSGQGASFRVTCKKIMDCGLTQYWFDTDQEAIDAWNRRAGDGK